MPPIVGVPIFSMWPCAGPVLADPLAPPPHAERPDRDRRQRSVTESPTAAATRIEVIARSASRSASRERARGPRPRDALTRTRSPGRAARRTSSRASSTVGTGSRCRVPRPRGRRPGDRRRVVAHRDQPLDAQPRDQLADPLVLLGRGDRPELGHVAQHRDAPPVARHPPRGLQRGRHRRRGWRCTRRSPRGRRPRSSNVSIRQPRHRRRRERCGALPAATRRARCPRRDAASAFDTMCSPGTASVDRIAGARPAYQDERAPGRRGPARRPRRGRPRPPRSERHHRGAGVRSRLPATTGSSAFSTATPSAGAPRPARPWPSTMRSHEPNSSRCATPTFVTTPMSGRATAHRSRMWPIARGCAHLRDQTTSVSAAPTGASPAARPRC